MSNLIDQCLMPILKPFALFLAWFFELKPVASFCKRVGKVFDFIGSMIRLCFTLFIIYFLFTYIIFPFERHRDPYDDQYDHASWADVR